MDVEITLFDKRVRPDLPQKLLFVDERAAIPYEDEKNLEIFWRQRNWGVIAEKQPFANV
ncbi:MAG: hypothetical protein L0Z53_11775 [Acidobacteriales bacterium]|nr:hypothetical protein [Terriglobales bacterium]